MKFHFKYFITMNHLLKFWSLFRLPKNFHVGQEDRNDGEKIRNPGWTGQVADYRLAGRVPSALHRRYAQVLSPGTRQMDRS